MGLLDVVKAVASPIASVIGGGLGFVGQQQTNAQSAAEAEKNRQFQERMSNTAVRRRMADMRAGGINPILAAKYDASTPAGAMANFGNPGAAAASGFSQMGNTATQIAQNQDQIDYIQSKVELNEQQAMILSTIADMAKAAKPAIDAVSNWLTTGGPEDLGKLIGTHFGHLSNQIKKAIKQSLQDLQEGFMNDFGPDFMNEAGRNFGRGLYDLQNELIRGDILER